MRAVSVLIAEGDFLTRCGLKTLISEYPGFNLVGEALDKEDLFEKISLHNPDVVLLDVSSPVFGAGSVKELLAVKKNIRLLAFTRNETKTHLLNVLESGVTSFLLKSCDKDEIIEAVDKSAVGEKFICSQILQQLVGDEKTSQ